MGGRLFQWCWMLPAFGLGSTLHAAEAPLDDLEVPPGFSISVYAEGVDDARQMAVSDPGTVFVGSRRGGHVHAVRDTDGDGTADEVEMIASDLTLPSGVAFKDGALYVGAVSTIYRYPDIEAQLRAGGELEREVVTDALPSAAHHGWKYLRFAPDGALYVPVGAPCNICLPDQDPRFASILKMDPATGDTEVFAEGIRNTVGFDFHPETGVLWFTDNGRDMLGDDVPPEELNAAPEPGLHFGYPFIHGGDIPDPEFGEGEDPDDYEPPRLEIQAHAAAIGMTFYTGEQFPERYHNAVFMAEHGSWNRSSKVGYRVSVAFIENGEVVGYEPFVEGWLQGEEASGRPADVLELPDGSVLIADDQGNRIWRVTYTGE